MPKLRGVLVVKTKGNEPQLLLWKTPDIGSLKLAGPRGRQQPCLSAKSLLSSLASGGHIIVPLFEAAK